MWGGVHVLLLLLSNPILFNNNNKLGENIINLILKINNYYTTKIKKFTVNAYEKYLKND